MIRNIYSTKYTDRHKQKMGQAISLVSDIKRICI